MAGSSSLSRYACSPSRLARNSTDHRCSVLIISLMILLQGGYDIDAISVSALACAEVLLGDPPAMLPPLQASDSATQTIHEVALVQSRHWTSISPKATEPRDSLSLFFAWNFSF